MSLTLKQFREATLNEIIALVQKFFADVNVSYSDMVLGLLLLKGWFTLSFATSRANLYYYVVHPGNQVVRTEIPVEKVSTNSNYFC